VAPLNPLLSGSAEHRTVGDLIDENGGAPRGDAPQTGLSDIGLARRTAREAVDPGRIRANGAFEVGSVRRRKGHQVLRRL